jgi:hypothetical protein
MIVEILYFQGCPNHERLIEHVPGLLAREGLTADVVLREVADADQARRERFLGSPTVRVDGRDIDPGAAERTDYGLKCRLYRTAGGLTGLPPDAWVFDAIRERRGERP